jgi:hypothetical protein
MRALVQATQRTVNNQIVHATLMAMCDDPTHVSIGEVWRKERMNIRIPIVVTGNDFSTLFAPLIRDGRMDKCALARRCDGWYCAMASAPCGCARHCVVGMPAVPA